MPLQTNHDFEDFCKQSIAYLEQDLLHKNSWHDSQVKFNKEHAEEIMDDLRAGSVWVSIDEPTPEHWYPKEREDILEIYRCEEMLRKWRIVLQRVTDHSPQMNLSEMSLYSFPQDICELSYLTSLNISGNELRTLPKEIGRLTNLIVLNVSKNKISDLPVEIGQLVNLEQLDLSNNPLPLSNLPPEIEQLVNLNTLKI